MFKNDKRASFGWSMRHTYTPPVTVPQEHLLAFLDENNAQPLTLTGAQRSYGDACVGHSRISSRSWRRMIHFDGASGVVVAQSGITLHELLQVTLPQQWFLHVTPGTRHITLGGAVAADVHGKNHVKKGNFSNFVLYFDLMIGSGEVLRCSREEHAKLFWLTCGGMGNTGIILTVALQLRHIANAQMDTFTQKCPDFESVFHSLEELSGWEYASAWVDFLGKGNHCGRGIAYFANHTLQKAGISRMEDFTPPQSIMLPRGTEHFSWILRLSTMRFYNRWRYAHSRQGAAIASIFDCLYPLDNIYNWNLLYGTSGFLQYHCCVPEASALEVFLKFKALMQQIQWFPYLAVLKKHEKSEPENVNAFSLRGYSLALDFPNRPQTRQLFRTFDALLLEHGGRIYLAKDACSDQRLSMLHPDTFADRVFGSLQKDRLQAD